MVDSGSAECFAAAGAGAGAGAGGFGFGFGGGARVASVWFPSEADAFAGTEVPAMVEYIGGGASAVFSASQGSSGSAGTVNEIRPLQLGHLGLYFPGLGGVFTTIRNPQYGQLNATTGPPDKIK
jgi:hypothetical protein